MTRDLGFTCSCCGAHHPELPMNYTAEAPAVWDPAFAEADDCLLSSDQCVIHAQHYFVKGLVEIPVIGSDEVFSWAVWVSLSRENFSRAADLWDTPGRESEKPYFGWLTTDLLAYSPTTLNLKTHVHTRPLGRRPFIELEPTDPPPRRRAAHGDHPGPRTRDRRNRTPPGRRRAAAMGEARVARVPESLSRRARYFVEAHGLRVPHRDIPPTGTHGSTTECPLRRLSGP